MGEMIEALRRLQEVELQLAAIRRSREAKERRVAVHQRQAKLAEAKLETQKKTITERQIRLDALTLDVTAREESIDKHREALNKAKTNKEYGAILEAMNTEKADTAKIESSILELMEEVIALQSQADEMDAEKVDGLEHVATARKALETLDAESADERTRLEAKREECSHEIPPAMLSSFIRVAQHHDGEAMATVTKLHPKREEYACDGCNMKITLEVVNALRSRDEVQPCQFCGRILYLDSQPARS